MGYRFKECIEGGRSMSEYMPIITEEREYQELLNSTSYHAVVIDPEINEIIDVGARTHEIFNVDSSALKGMHLIEFNKLLMEFIARTSCISIDKNSRVVLVDQIKVNGHEEKVIISQVDYKLGDKHVELLKISHSRVDHEDHVFDLNRILVESDDGLIVVDSNDIMEGIVSFANEQALKIMNVSFDNLYNTPLKAHLEGQFADNMNTYRIINKTNATEELLSIETLKLKIGSIQFQIVKINKVKYINNLDHRLVEDAISNLKDLTIEQPGFLIDIGFYFEEPNIKLATHVLDAVISILSHSFRANDIDIAFVAMETDIFCIYNIKSR